VRKQVTALEPNDHHASLQTPDEPIGPSSARLSAAQPSAGRFLYAGGTCPLNGYTIKRGVGQGGFGEIYFAVSDAGKEVALKLIRRNLDVELRGIRQCLNLKHPNLLNLYDIRQDDQGDTWVVMEYASGQSLEGVLDARPDGLSLAETLSWIHGIGAGVAYLHERGIVHRDLKPGNIFCDEGIVKVGDYGLSKFISCSRRSGHTESIGTVHYMAPEVANGRYGKEIDVYALGVILYELLTGRMPFEGESVGEILMKHLTAKPDVSMLAEPYRGIVAKALEKDPSLRFRSAAEFTTALPALPNDPCAFNHVFSRGLTAPGNETAHESETADSGERCPPARGVAVVDAEGTPEEPVLREVRKQGQKLLTTWNKANLNTPLKILILLAGLFVFMLNATVLVPLAIVLCAMYGLYRLAWTFSSRAGKTDTPRRQTGSATPVVPDADTRRRWGEKPVPVLVVKPPRERMTELVGSLLVSSAVVAAMCVVMVLIQGYRADVANVPKPEQFAWLLLVSLTGTWAVLIPAKLWEGVRGEPIIRRFLLMVLGIGVGVIAFGLATVLMAGLPSESGFPASPDFRLPPSFYAIDGRPLMMAYVACFGTLFLLMQWWRQADPLRPARLSLWALLLSVIVAGFVAMAWQFPQPWLPMVAGTMSVATQLASPWHRKGKQK